MLSDRCPSACLSCPVLSVTFVHCGQTVGRIKMKLGRQVGLGPGHIVLDRDPAPPPQRGTAQQFSAHIGYGQMAAWIKMSLGVELGLGPGDFVLDVRYGVIKIHAPQIRSTILALYKLVCMYVCMYSKLSITRITVWWDNKMKRKWRQYN